MSGTGQTVRKPLLQLGLCLLLACTGTATWSQEEFGEDRWYVAPSTNQLRYTSANGGSVTFDCGESLNEPNVQMSFYVPLSDGDAGLRGIASKASFMDSIGFKPENSPADEPLREYRGRATLTYGDGTQDLFRSENFLQVTLGVESTEVSVPKRFIFRVERPYAFSGGPDLPLEVDMHAFVAHLLPDLKSIAFTVSDSNQVKLAYEIAFNDDDDPRPAIEQFVQSCEWKNPLIGDPARRLFR